MIPKFLERYIINGREDVKNLVYSFIKCFLQGKPSQPLCLTGPHAENIGGLLFEILECFLFNQGTMLDVKKTINPQALRYQSILYLMTPEQVLPTEIVNCLQTITQTPPLFTLPQNF